MQKQSTKDQDDWGNPPAPNTPGKQKESNESPNYFRISKPWVYFSQVCFTGYDFIEFTFKPPN